jgi:hypothetical protein
MVDGYVTLPTWREAQDLAVRRARRTGLKQRVIACDCDGCQIMRSCGSPGVWAVFRDPPRNVPAYSSEIQKGAGS